LASLEFLEVLNRAEDRIQEAILYSFVSGGSKKEDIEIVSFPIAVMIVAASANKALKGRYALAESKRVSELLNYENDEKIIILANNFKWKIRPINVSVGSQNFNFSLFFTDFLKNGVTLQDNKWKLVNRFMLKGEVYLTRNEIIRLFEEEVRRHIEQKLNIKVKALPSNLKIILDRLELLFSEKFGKTQFFEIPKVIIENSFPPCIKKLYDETMSSHQISHIGRFTLTSFLSNIGMSIKDIINLFRSFTDFKERMTRYQVEHIAGKRGSQTKYIPPRCDTLQTHGICPGKEAICRRIRHPLAYYRIAVNLKKKSNESS
jgi:DNA primase large subunit